MARLRTETRGLGLQIQKPLLHSGRSLMSIIVFCIHTCTHDTVELWLLVLSGAFDLQCHDARDSLTPRRIALPDGTAWCNCKLATRATVTSFSG